MNYYDRDGNLMTRNDWTSKVEDSNYRIVARSYIGDVVISTVWLGLNHNWSGEGDPVIFETLVVGGEHDGYMDRYTTEEDAFLGHVTIRQAVKYGTLDE